MNLPEPTAHQFQDTYGEWCDFMNESHYENTVKDGRWPIRAMYSEAQVRETFEPVLKQALDALSAIDPLFAHLATDVTQARWLEKSSKAQSAIWNLLNEPQSTHTAR